MRHPWPILFSRCLRGLFPLGSIGALALLATACQRSEQTACCNDPRPLPQVSTTAPLVQKRQFCALQMIHLSHGIAYFVQTPDARRAADTSIVKMDHIGRLSDIDIGARAWGVARDFRDNVYFRTSASVVKMTPDGKTSTLAMVDATDVTLSDIAADADGNVYLRDGRMPVVRIRKIGSDGAVTTLFKGELPDIANNENNSSDNKPNNKAFAVDSKGDIYLGNQESIFKINAHGAASLLVGGATHFGAAATSIAIDANDNLYVKAGGLRKVTPGGTITTLVNNKSTAPDLIDGDVGSSSIAIDSTIDVDVAGNVYFTDCEDNAYRKITTDGKVLTIIRSNFERAARY
jgi:hypothetical protein